MGFYHGMPVTSAPTGFSSAWADFVTKGPYSDPNTVRAHLVRSFAALGHSNGSCVDVGTAPIAYVEPDGFVGSAVPTAFSSDDA